MSADPLPNYDPANEVNILNLQFVHVDRFAFVIKTLIENGLLDEAIERLKSRGCHLLAISIEPLEIIQEALRQSRAARASEGDIAVENSAEARLRRKRLEQFEVSACSGPKYPPRPPDHWPEGPWDPPRQM